MSESFENAEPYVAPAAKPRGNVGARPRNSNPPPTPTDRVPPHNVEAEQATLAAIIIDGGGDILNTCIEKKVTPDYFYKTEHQIIYDACLKLGTKNTAIDEVTLTTFLTETNNLSAAGGFIYLNELTARIETTAHAIHWIEIVREKYFRRKLISTGRQTVEDAYTYSDTIESLLNKVEKNFLEIANDRVQESAQLIGDPNGPLDNALAMISRMAQSKGAITGIPTGFKRLDQMTFGLHPGQMIVIAARPGMGKTSIALNFIEAALFDQTKRGNVGLNVLMFSLEMTAQDLQLRLLASHSRVKLREVQRGFAKADEHKKLAQAARDFKSRKLYIDDVGGQTIMEMRAKARRLHARVKLDLIVIDYLQLINGTDNSVSREQQIAEASRSIKAMAKEFGIPIIALAQLNRKSEDENRAPRVSDLRESGSIEQDADVVMLIDKARGKKETEEEARIAGLYQRTLIIAKQRNGPVGEIPLIFHGDLTLFSEPEFNVQDPNE
ncbi:MAG: replicative DNA helicase [Opitutales bacterium]|nr:replicative DNA helicase [Opitutales bacterium]